MRSGPAALVPAVLLVAVAVWEIGATARARGEVPDDAAWRPAAALMREGFRDGDLIVFAPRWVDPVGRLHLGDLIPIETAARMDADRFAVIWEVSIRGARAPETAGLAPVTTQTIAGITVRRFERAPAVVITDLVAAAAALPDGEGASCGPTVVLAEVGFEPRRCVQVIPNPDASVHLDYGQLELGSTLVGHVGLADVFTRRDVRAPGRLEVKIDDEIVATVVVGVDDGWRRFEAATTPGRHHVEVIATAVGKKARDRLICFAAEARR